MSDKVKYIYGKQFAQKLPGSPNNPLLPNQGNYYFRTATSYKVDSNGKPIEGTARTNLYYAPKSAARTSDGKTWTPGTADSADNFNQGGWVLAGSTRDNGKNYLFREYTQEDADLGRIPPGKNVGDEVLGATARQSLTTSGGRFYEAVQNNLINLAVNTQPRLAQVISAKQKNVAQQQQAAAAAAAGTPITDELSQSLNVNGTIDGKNFRDNYGSDNNLKYPLDRSSDQDYIKFTMFKYDGRSLGGEEGITKDNISTFKPGPRRLKQLDGSVSLPIQPSITDSNGVEWGGANLSAIDAYVASLSLGAMNSREGLTGLASDILGKVQQNVKDLTVDGSLNTAFKLYLAQEAVGIQGLLSRATGAIINPNLELLFNGPTLRSFNFTFRLSPRSENEANNVKRIIRFFKEGMSVQTAASNVFLKAPNLFDISYVGKSSKSLNKIKTCALLGCDVDYTPDGSYMTFNDGTMTSYQLTLRFSEVDPIYSEDYSGLSETEIGY